MTVLLQVSDPHFGTERPAVVEALAAMAASQRPQLIVLSGDITQRATKPQFKAARRFVDRLGAPVLAIPGNHDIPLLALGTRLLNPYARFREAFGDDLEPVHSSTDMLVLGLNTTRPWRHKDGVVDAAQVQRIAARLAVASARQLRVVVVHQPIAVVREVDLPDRLHGAGPALQRWAAAGADVVLGGHIHLPYLTHPAGLPRPLWVAQAGTAVSSRVRAGVPNSVNLLRWGTDAAPGRCIVEQWDHDAGLHTFVCRARTEIEPARGTGGR